MTFIKFQSTSLIAQRWNSSPKEGRQCSSVSIHISDCSEMKCPALRTARSLRTFQSTSLIAQRWNKVIEVRPTRVIKFQSTSLIAQRWNFSSPPRPSMAIKFQSTSLIAQRWNQFVWLICPRLGSFNPHLWLLRDEMFFAVFEEIFNAVSIHISDCSEMKSKIKSVYKGKKRVSIHISDCSEMKCCSKTLSNRGRGFNPHLWLLRDEIALSRLTLRW